MADIPEEGEGVGSWGGEAGMMSVLCGHTECEDRYTLRSHT